MTNTEGETGFLIQYVNFLGFQKLLVFCSAESHIVHEWFSTIARNPGLASEKELESGPNMPVVEDMGRSQSAPRNVEYFNVGPVTVPARSNSLPKNNLRFFYECIPERMNAFYKPKNDMKRNSQLRDMANKLIVISKKEDAEVEVENGLHRAGTLQRVQIVDATEYNDLNGVNPKMHQLQTKIGPEEDDDDFQSFSPSERIYPNQKILSTLTIKSPESNISIF